MLKRFLARQFFKRENSEPELPEDYSGLTGIQIWVLAAFISALTILICGFLPKWIIQQDIPRLLEPLRTGGPVVIVNYAIFMLPAFILTGPVMATIAIGLVAKHIWPQLAPRIEAVGRFMMWFAVAAVFWLFVVGPILGKATEFYVASQGYEHCDPLTYVGVSTYRPGYVEDPRLCVHHYDIEEALARHGYEPLPGK